MIILLSICIRMVNSQVTCDSPSFQTFNYSIVSDELTQVLDSSFKIKGQAIKCLIDSGWTASIPWASWIWDGYNDQTIKTVVFQVSFFIPGVPSYGSLRIAVDNTHSVIMNGNDIGCTGGYYKAGMEKNCDISSNLVSGMNTAIISVYNSGGPGGLLYRIDGSSKV